MNLKNTYPLIFLFENVLPFHYLPQKSPCTEIGGTETGLLKSIERLELYAEKFARTVLRGGHNSNVVSLPDQQYYKNVTILFQICFKTQRMLVFFMLIWLIKKLNYVG
ncbi:hypothetical protein A9G26_11955 [Gilliamella sp. Bim1-2]|nr:hypothetical protein A9G32_10450 [Gilliamella apicola]OCG53116.1 hypothetical protein A9G26_11955 [Gilliamella apicola]